MAGAFLELFNEPKISVLLFTRLMHRIRPRRLSCCGEIERQYDPDKTAITWHHKYPIRGCIYRGLFTNDGELAIHNHIRHWFPLFGIGSKRRGKYKLDGVGVKDSPGK